MPTTTLANAVVQPLDEGVGSIADGTESYSSAAAVAALAAHVDGAYHEGLAPTNLSTANDTADVGPGRGYVLYSGGSGNLQSGRSGGGAAYDTSLAASVPLLVEVPSTVTLSLDANASNDVYLAVDLDGATTGTPGDAYLQFGSSVSAPSDPSVLLGIADTASGATTAANGPPAVLTDSGSDTDGGDDYQLPNASDNIDLQGGGSLLGVESVTANNIKIDGGLSQYQVSGKAVPVSPSFGVENARDSVQAAIDVIDNAGESGAVILPNSYMSEDSTIEMKNGVSLLNPTGGFATPEQVLQVFSGTDPGIRFGEQYTGGMLGGFVLRGPGFDQETGQAINFDSGPGDVRNNFWYPIEINQWGNSAIEQTSGRCYQNVYTNILANQVDAGATGVNGAVFKWISGALSTVLGYMGVNAFDDYSNADSRVLQPDTKGLQIRYLFANGTLERLIRHADAPPRSILHVDQAWYEASNQNSRPNSIVQLSDGHFDRVENLRCAQGNTEDIYQINGGANKYIAAPQREAVNVTGDIVNIRFDTIQDDGPVIYEGRSADVVNNTGSTLTEPVTCLGDLTRVS